MGKRKKADTVSAKKQARLPKDGKVNPFEVRVNRKKHDILGQRSKSDKGLPGISRSKAIQKRKKTLLQEYKRRNKSNLFIDRRFGEYDEGLSPEERMMRRFVMEKQKRHNRGGLFNLEEEGEGLTHYGQSLGDMERFDDIQISEGEEEEEDIGETHFGGFLRKKRPRVDRDDPEEKEEKPRSRKEIMEEVVTKSKASKLERQTEKREVDNLLDQMDSDWKEISGILKVASSEKKMTSGVADDYDRAVRELVFEKRGQPTDRLKSEEELAREERQRLEKLEADRLHRMKGLPPRAQEVTEHISADYIPETLLAKGDERVTLRYKDGKIVLPDREDSHSSESSGVSEDELGEEMSEDQSLAEGEAEESEDEDTGMEDSEEDNQSEEDEAKEGSSEMEDETEEEDPAETYGSDLESEDEGEEVSVPSETREEEEGSGGGEKEEEGGIDMEEAVRELMAKELREEAAKELPYTFEVPRCLREFRTIVDLRSPEECQTAVERIYTCNHPSLSAENRHKLERFLSVLAEFSLQLGQDPTMTKLATLSHLTRPLFKLAQLNSVHTAGVFRKLLKGAHKRWSKHRKGHPKYPPFSDLLLLKLIGLLFPTSDFKHPIATPAMLFMGQLLIKCRIGSLYDLVCGLFLCQILRECISLSKRFVPEMLNFITSAVGCFSESRHCVFYPPFSSKSKLRKELSQCSDQLTTDYSLLQLVVLSNESSTAQQTRYAVLKIVLELVGQLSELYEGLPSFTELFTPLSTNIQSVADQELSPQTKELCAGVLRSIAARCSVPKVMLQLLKQKPKSIKFYEPKFDEEYAVGRKKAGSRTVAERQKLRYKVKREMKGAVREIRKDNAFLAKEKLKETLERDAERKRKIKQILHDLQMQQFEAKMERIKKK